MLRVHHLNASRAKRTVWLLEELELAYDLVRHERDPKTNLAPESFTALHPFAKAPMLEDGAVRIIESGAIAQYILARYGNGRLEPERNSPDYPYYLQWLHAAEGAALLPGLMCFYLKNGRVRNTPLNEYAESERTAVFRWIEAELRERPYFVGNDFTAADIAMTYVLEATDRRGGVREGSSVSDYLIRMRARPAYKRMAAINAGKEPTAFATPTG